MTQGWEKYTLQRGPRRCIANLACLNQIALMGLIDRNRQQSICELQIAANQERRDVLIHENKENTSCIAVAIKVTTWLNLQEPASFSKIHLPAAQSKWSHTEMWEEPWVLYVSNYNPSRNMILFLFTVVLRSKPMTSMVFPNIVFFTLWISEPMWVILLTS